jgi:hypothetical protein
MATVKSVPASKAKWTRLRPFVRKPWKRLAAVRANSRNKRDSKGPLYLKAKLICHFVKTVGHS